MLRKKIYRKAAKVAKGRRGSQRVKSDCESKKVPLLHCGWDLQSQAVLGVSAVRHDLIFYLGL
jgi:hypothetical protein